jgi:hypothetical protein
MKIKLLYRSRKTDSKETDSKETDSRKWILGNFCQTFTYSVLPGKQIAI